MISRMNAPLPKSPAPVIWWILWAAITGGLIAIYVALRPTAPAGAPASLRYVPLVPFAAAVLVRWFVLPRFREGARAFPLFIVGLALAEACGIIGLFLVPDLAPTYLVLGLAGLLLFAPFFAAKYPR